MSTASQASERAARQWFIVGRWQEFEGEDRANLLRVCGIAAFYGVELLRHGQWLGPTTSDTEFHRLVTSLAAAYATVALGVHLCLRQRVLPSALKYASTAADLAILTCLMLVGDGPKSPLIVLYFLVIALAGLRFSLRLVWLATAGSLAGYLLLLCHARWYSVSESVPRDAQLIVAIAIVLGGVILGKVVRRVRQIAADYAARVNSAETNQE